MLYQKSQKKGALLVLILAMFYAASLLGQKDLTIVRPGFVYENITPDMFRDSTQTIIWDSVRLGIYDTRFVSTGTPFFALGLDPASWWLKFRVKNELSSSKTIIFRINRKNFDKLSLYQRISDNDWKAPQNAGTQQISETNFLLTEGFHFPITLPASKTTEFVVRVSNKIGAAHLGLSLHSPENFSYLNRFNALFFGLFLGVMFISLIFAGALFYHTKDRLYIFYTIYIFNILCRESFGYAADFGFMPLIQRHIAPMFIAVTFGVFAREFMRVWELNKWLDRIIVSYFGCITLAGVCMWFAVSNGYATPLKFLIELTQLLNLCFIFIAFWIMLRYFRVSPRVKLLMISYLPMAIAFIIITLRNFHIIEPYPIIQHSIMSAFILEVLILTVGFVSWLRELENQQRMAVIRLEMEQKEGELAVTRTKERIARDLHDDVAASISGIRLLAQVAQQQVQNQAPEAAALLLQINKTAQSTAESISDLIWVEKPGHETLDDLADRIREYCLQILGGGNINYQVEIDHDLPIRTLDAVIRRNIMMIFKETVNNAVKYSECSTLSIQMRVEESGIYLVISDDGKGFDTNLPAKGNGLKNMYIRAKEIGAVLEISSQPAVGTKMTLIFQP